jgi:hypothetical protein
VTAVRDGSPVALGAPKQRSLLAALALHGGRAVPPDTLVDLLWGDDAPPAAGALLQTYVAGRQSEALADLRDVRSVLAEDLGIEPGPGLQALETAVLRQSVLTSRREQAARHRRRDGGRTVGDVELVERAQQVGLHRRLGDVQPLADFGVRAALRDQRQHLDLPGGQAGPDRLAHLADLADEPSRDRRREDGLAAMGGPDRGDQFRASFRR